MTRAMRYQLAGLLCAAFAITTFVGSIIAGIFLGALSIDLGAVIVICIAARVVEGSPRAARWCAGIMSLYCLVAASLILVAWLWPESMRVGKRPMGPGDLPWAAALGGTMAIWSASCVVCLLRALRCSPPAWSSPGAAVSASG